MTNRLWVSGPDIDDTDDVVPAIIQYIIYKISVCDIAKIGS